MADQGAIGFSRYDAAFVRYDPLTYAGGDVLNPIRQDAVISGETRVAGVLTPDVEVYLIWRPSMTVVKGTRSNADGTYSFNNLAASTTEYVVYFKDPPGGTVYNDLVFALIDTTP